MNRCGRCLVGLGSFVAAMCPNAALAHVKWFSREFDFSDAPLTLGEVLSSALWLMVALSLVTIALLVALDERIGKMNRYRRFEAWLDARRASAPMVMRVTVGIVLLLCWQAGVLLAPELVHGSSVVEWIQFVLILCLFHPRSTPIAGVGVVILFVVGAVQFGLFHMLDYVTFLGVGCYLIFHASSATSWQRLANPALFAATGFSLCWLSMEKLIYPQWSLLLLRENPTLTLGLSPEFFLVGAAFVEFCLGYLLLIGLLSRPLASIITLVFFLTTMVFGKDEFIGHSVLHGILIVFMLEGAGGALKPPIRWHSGLGMRVSFATVNFALAFILMIIPYHLLARSRGATGSAESLRARAGEMSVESNHPRLLVDAATAPAVELSAVPREQGGWTLFFDVTGMEFARTEVGTPHQTGQGHVHLYVDGQARSQVFEDNFELEELGPGRHTVVAELGTNDHRVYATQLGPIRASTELERTTDLDFDENDLIYFQPLPARMDTTKTPAPALVNLGRRLFYDERLSGSGEISCNDCHSLDRFGVDNETLSAGHGGRRAKRNSPTLYNSGFAIAQFWDGRARDLEEQAKEPFLNPAEMGMQDARHVESLLASLPVYRRDFESAFPGQEQPVTYDNVALAIAAFERGLTTPGRFDRFLMGERDELTGNEKRGLRKFLELGCATCHNGAAIGGRSFQRVGLVIPYDDEEDLGRFEVTSDPQDKQLFKVPSLRNIGMTGPYFHNGRLDTLEEAVKTMARHQLGRVISTTDARLIRDFLLSLTGELPKDYVAPPAAE